PPVTGTHNRTGAPEGARPTAVPVTRGAYAFAGLPAGTYQVRWRKEPGRRATTPDGGVYEVDLSHPDRTVTGLDFGNAVSIDQVLTIPADGGTGDWTVLLNRGRLEVLDSDLGVL